MCANGPRAPAEVAEDMNLPLEVVEEAIAYCRTDPPEIRQDLEREERLMEATGMNDPDYCKGGRYRLLPPEELAKIRRS